MITPAANIAGAVAAQQQAQGQGDVQRAGREAANQERQQLLVQRAEMAAGVGRADEKEHAADRDADGRQLWEFPTPRTPEESQDDAPPRSRDASGTKGQTLDLTA
jgi:hypothetical protein